MAQGAAAARRLTIVVVTAGVAVVGLAGCGKDEAPPAPPSSILSPAPTSASPTPTPTPTPTPPAKPAEWTQNDDAGALAAAQYFMDLFAYVNRTGDLADWSVVSGADCDFCSGNAADVSAIYGSGGHIEGATFEMTDPQLVGYSATLNVRTVQFAYTAQAGRAVDSAGTTLRTYDAESGFLLLDVGWTGETWILMGGHATQESAAL